MIFLSFLNDKAQIPNLFEADPDLHLETKRDIGAVELLTVVATVSHEKNGETMNDGY